MAWHPVFRLGKEKACVEQAVLMTTPPLWCHLESSVFYWSLPAMASFFLVPTGNYSVFGSQGNRTNRIYLVSRYMHSQIHTGLFKAFAHAIVQAGKSKSAE